MWTDVNSEKHNARREGKKGPEAYNHNWKSTYTTTTTSVTMSHERVNALLLRGFTRSRTRMGLEWKALRKKGLFTLQSIIIINGLKRTSCRFPPHACGRSYDTIMVMMMYSAWRCSRAITAHNIEADRGRRRVKTLFVPFIVHSCCCCSLCEACWYHKCLYEHQNFDNDFCSAQQTTNFPVKASFTLVGSLRLVTENVLRAVSDVCDS